MKFPRVAADAVVLRPGKEGAAPEVLLITRKKKTFQGCFAFPGGHVDYDEDPQVACVRELKEETGIEGKLESLLTVHGEPGRDPRYHMISIFYLVSADADAVPTAMDDAASADWYDL